jgi:hypothetical protein
MWCVMWCSRKLLKEEVPRAAVGAISQGDHRNGVQGRASGARVQEMGQGGLGTYVLPDQLCLSPQPPCCGL